jgi:hypothetical protein
VGNRFAKWFATGRGGTIAYRLAAAYVHGLARWATGFSRPEFVSLQDLRRVAEYLASSAVEDQPLGVVTSPSHAVRVCLAGRQCGVPLRGITFLLGAEPLTGTRKTFVQQAGANAVPNYGFSEAGTVGCQCPDPTAPDDVHVAQDAFAVIQQVSGPGDGESIGALLLTTLKPASPKVMLNAEIGDSAVVEVRRCGCRFDEVGYHQHLHTIRSFEKLTGEGVTFVGADLFPILEEVLPKRFGGTLADYQLIEEQDGVGLPRYSLRVSPEVGWVDHTAVLATLLGELARRRPQYRFMVNQWIGADIIRLKRERPVVTARGKLLPFWTLKRQ